MLELEKISRIGFGTYRISNDEQHENALLFALLNGCNLIDTASNYSNGMAESTIGRILKSVDGSQIFLVTKAGYVSGDNLKVLAELNFNAEESEHVVTFQPDFKHCFHPKYLEAQMEISLKRLDRTYIDCFLLHSPEYYFKQDSHLVTNNDFFFRIKMAFQFLENCVKKGKIRYYGISSNSFYLVTEKNWVNLAELVRIASDISKSHHFKFIQFPYNIVERNACEAINTDGKTLVGFAKTHNLITLSNRPLNANTKSGVMRLVRYKTESNDAINDRETCSACFKILEDQLVKIGEKGSFSEFPLIEYLNYHWEDLPNSDSVDKIFYQNIYPFLSLIFGNEIPKTVIYLFQKFELIVKKYALTNSTNNLLNYLETNNLSHLINSSTNVPLPFLLCKEYLNAGIDHILIGMRKKDYVSDLVSLF